MNTHSFIRILGLQVAVFSIMGCHSSPEPVAAKSSEMKKNPKSYTVQIIQMAFKPAVINVEQGDTIVFNNQDLVTHNVTDASGSDWTALPIAPGTTWILTAQKSANYFCSFHPVMKGEIVVE